jgi:hypothetical protein
VDDWYSLIANAGADAGALAFDPITAAIENNAYAITGYDFDPVFAAAPSWAPTSDTVRTIFGAAKDVGQGILSFAQLGASIDAQREALRTQRAQNASNMEITRLQAGSAVDLAKIAGETALARARANLAREAATPGVSSRSRYDKLMLLLTVAGLGIAWLQFSKGRR